MALGSVYVIECVGTPYVKIGFTTQSVGQRLRTLKTGNPLKLNPLVWIDGFKGAEKTLHARFAAYHHDDEWYRLEGRLRAWVEEMVLRGKPEGGLV